MGCRSVVMAPLCSWCGCCGCYGVVGTTVLPAPATAPEPAKETPKVMPKVSDPESDSATSSARVVIKAPVNVRITVNGQATDRNAAEMTFRTPALRLSKEYSYQVKAEVVRDGRTVTESREVTILAGQKTVIDFSHLQAPVSTAMVTMNLPADAKLYVNGAAYTLPARERTFKTPTLTQGKEYVYEFKAQVVRDGKTQSETRKVTVAAGKHVKVDFAMLDAVQTASR